MFLYDTLMHSIILKTMLHVLESSGVLSARSKNSPNSFCTRAGAMPCRQNTQQLIEMARPQATNRWHTEANDREAGARDTKGMVQVNRETHRSAAWPQAVEHWVG